MSNRPRDAIKWDRPVQVMVSDYTANKLKALSQEKRTTMSGLCREILDDYTNTDQASESC